MANRMIRTRFVSAWCVSAALGIGLVTASVAIASPPENDDIEDAWLLNGWPGNAPVVGSTVDATEQAGEPDHAENEGGASVWFYMDPVDYDREWVAHTCGSDFDTLLSVYLGVWPRDDFATLFPLAANDESRQCESQSWVEFQPAPEYFGVAVDGYDDPETPDGPVTGNYSLAVAPRPVALIESRPPIKTDARKAHFLFSLDSYSPYGQEGSTFRCSLDGERFEKCSRMDGITYRKLETGRHVFRVKARQYRIPQSGATSYSWKVTD